MEQATFNRMVVEFNELVEKTEKLRDFLLNKADKAPIDNLNKDLLISQLKAMETYQGILSIRIGLNNKEEWLTASEDVNKENNVENNQDLSSTKDNEIVENAEGVSE